ncbi:MULTISPECIES: alpha-glucuronidase family glycosyl hydrolase [unclassified Roseateles]|uniref:alpha-glucuronidase family glycosyl hydrolase n=1 Tax=unclassified Roseateles TaxID=2626991 RepID=UPI0006FCD8CF|nr:MULTISPECIES: alpha-glucuronidase family glycosyl hydrolase [unclassified Roseateles]KQW46217.1 alpha-glucuronidase [Pelomonas sp. Root405]KRA73266.1 alpha-glucuronidase [Pelomonas sp. Root662]
MKTWAQALAGALLAAVLHPAWSATVEDGYELWLRYRTLPAASQAALPRSVVHAQPASPTLQVAVAELKRGVAGLGGRPLPSASKPANGALVLATPANAPAGLTLPWVELGREGYLLRSVKLQGRPVTLIAANTDLGLLYGSHAWLRAAQTGANLAKLDVRAAPRLSLRLLNHWDNLDRTVERGYAGASIWDWWKLPDIRDARYVDYARANASLGINGTVLNNVNAKADSLTAPFLAKAAALADVFRPHGIRVYLSARFSSPAELGGLKTSDPLDPAVRAWWKAKAAEIYKAIPDFGGFLVKANSEGQPGPQDYGRNHADGANMLAEALAPHGGVVLWRAFVYSPDASDRAAQGYAEFKPLDGKFAPNVIVQVKNGAIDFQPREPFHPLFGAMPATPLALELQITKEYLGFSTHLVYMGPLFEEVLKADTRVKPQGATVAAQVTAMAGVANIGTDRNWSGSHFDQANWYAFGRLAWDQDLAAGAVAREWVQQTFTTRPHAVDAIVAMMLASREAVVDYMTPLGLHHLMGTGHHHGPAPWVDNLERADWNPVYFHRAARDGIGFDRSPRGSNAVAQYAPELAQRFANPATTPENLLLWFHRLPWEHRMASGRTLWAELVSRYDRGVTTVGDLRQRWAALQADIDPKRHAEVAAYLAVQEAEARWWRDACIAYFQSVSGLPLPAGTRPPERSLEEYKALQFNFAPGRGG